MKKAALFVHGLAGSKETWGDFKNLIEQDGEVSDFDVDYYEYPSARIRLFPYFQKSYGTIQALGRGLKTYIEHKLDQYDEIALIGHSLGGLVIREYLLQEHIGGSSNNVQKVALYAVPNEGSELANIGNTFSIGHKLLKQLCKKSFYLSDFNITWGHSKVENSYDFRVIVAVEDQVVSVDSATANFRHHNPITIAGKDHKSVVKPDDNKDLSFLVLQRFLSERKPITKSNPSGALKYHQWLAKDGKTPFFADESRVRMIEQIRTFLSQDSGVIRIAGLSGLGKTRLVLNSIESIDESIQSTVLWIDASGDSYELVSEVNSWVSKEFTGCLVVDNCSPRLHDQLCRAVRRPESKLKLISIDTDIQKSGDCPFIVLGRLHEDSIKALLGSLFDEKIDDLDRIARFAQGFPQMAVLLANARINEDPTIGSLTDDNLADKLIWGGPVNKNRTDEKVLTGCSLFDRFGLDKEASSEYQYIADNIVDVSRADFYDCIRRFSERGLIDRRGRYAQFVPKPLAIRLAAQWWQRTHEDNQIKLLDTLPDQMVGSFCDQVEMLDFLPEVKEFTQTICGPQGPFGQAEVILSVRGSRLFRALVIANPEASSNAIYEILSNLSESDIEGIGGDVRRNLVWALERLCFHAEYFEKSAWCMLLLAVAENETWSNNSTGMFAQLFRVHLSGTAADPTARFRLLTRALALENAKFDAVVLEALEQAIDTYGASKTVGAEYQGSKPPLKEWRPTLWQEVFDYWEGAFGFFMQLFYRGSTQREKVLFDIGYSIRGFVARGRMEMLDSAIREIIRENGIHWMAALDSIKRVFEFDSQGMKPEVERALNDWLELLDPEEADLAQKLKIIVIDPPWDMHKDEDGNYTDVSAENAKKLGAQVANNIDELIPHLSLLSSGEQRQSGCFGVQLASKVDVETLSILIGLSLKALIQMEYGNFSFLLGLFRGAFEKDATRWQSEIDMLLSNSDYTYLYPEFISTGYLQKQHLDNLLSLIRDQKVPFNAASSLTYGRVTEHLDPEIISQFTLALSEVDDKAKWSALDVVDSYCRSNRGAFDVLRETLRMLVVSVPLRRGDKERATDCFRWKDLADKLLRSRDDELALNLTNQMITAAKYELDHSDIWHYLKPLLLDLMRDYGDTLWPMFGDAIIAAKGLELYWLQQLLDRENSDSNKLPSVLSVVPAGTVISWCKEIPDRGPEFVASCVNVFDTADGSQTPSPLFIALLENFGGDEKVQGALSANIGSGSWSGSLVPYLQADKAALTPLLESKNHDVRKWVVKYISYIDKQIEIESMREDERQLGIL